MSEPTRTLSDAHRATLHANGLPDSIIDARGYWTLSPEEIQNGALDLFRRHFKIIKPGLVIPQWSLEEAAEKAESPAKNWKIRLDEPDPEYGKYLSAVETRIPCFWQLDPDTLFSSSPLWLVEGVKDADALRGVLEAPACVVALPDCNGALLPNPSDSEGPKLLPEIVQIGAGRDILLVLDADIQSNADVHTAAGRTLELLNELCDGRAKLILLPGEDKEGIGDLLARDIDYQTATANQLSLAEFQDLPAPKAKRKGRPNKKASKQLHATRAEFEGDKYAHTNLARNLLEGGPETGQPPKPVITEQDQLSAKLRRGETTSELRMFQGDWLKPITDAEYRNQCRIRLDQIANAIQPPNLPDAAEQREATKLVANTRKYLRSRQTISAVAQITADMTETFDDVAGAVPPTLWPCPEGQTLDLETLQFVPTDPTTALFCAGVTPKEGETEAWDELMIDISKVNNWLGLAIEDALGWAMQGHRQDQALTFLAGASRAGKGVILRTAARIFGPFAHQAALGTFFSDGKKADQHLQHLSRHIGRRLITAPDPSGRLNRSLALSYSGGDQVTTEQKGGRNFEFTPTGAAFLHGQTDIIRLEFDDEALKARLRVLPFDISFAGREDKKLEQKLEAELPAIAWKLALRAKAYLKTGEVSSDQLMRQAATKLMIEFDPVGRWMEECCTAGTGWTGNKKLYRSYMQWCDREGEEIRPSRAWGRQMTTKRHGWDIIPEKRNNLRGYQGIQLRSDEDE